MTVSEIDEFVATADSTGTAEFTAVPSEALPETAFQNATVGFYAMDYAAHSRSARAAAPKSLSILRPSSPCSAYK